LFRFDFNFKVILILLVGHCFVFCRQVKQQKKKKRKMETSKDVLETEQQGMLLNLDFD